jgi:hypothetical protein
MGSITRPEREADYLTAICDPIVYTMWDPQHLPTLEVSTACYRDSFTSTLPSSWFQQARQFDIWKL